MKCRKTSPRPGVTHRRWKSNLDECFSAIGHFKKRVQHPNTTGLSPDCKFALNGDVTGSGAPVSGVLPPAV